MATKKETLPITKPKRRKFKGLVLMNRKKWPDFVIPAALLLIFTLLFRFTELDIRLQKFFYDENLGWYLKDMPLWRNLFYYGSLPGLILTLASVVALSASFWSARYYRLRKKALFIIICLALGPGLLVNVVLKDHWGRPRPRYVQQFGGESAFEYVCQEGFQGEGKSFPCGHCSIGFFLLTPYFIFRRSHKRWAMAFLMLGTGYGLLMGIARMIAGGHFASDAIWAGGIVYLVGAGTYYALGLHRNDRPPSKPIPVKNRKLSVTISIIVFHVIIAGMLLATPYLSQKTYGFKTQSDRLENYEEIAINLQHANLSLHPGDSLLMNWDIQGFGFPGSRVNLAINDDTLSQHYEFALREKGWFTELNNMVDGRLPYHYPANYTIRLRDGDVSLYLPEKGHSKTIHVFIEEGDLRLMVTPPVQVKINSHSDNVANFSDLPLQQSNHSYYTSDAAELVIDAELADGEIIIRNRAD